MAFEWSALRQFWKVRLSGDSSGFEPLWCPKWHVDQDRPPSVLLDARIGVLIRLEPGDGVTAVQVRILPHPPDLEGKSVGDWARLLSESHPQGCVHRAHCRPPISGCPLGGSWSPKPTSRVRFLDGPPDYSGASCWYPSCALNAQRAHSTRAACVTVRALEDPRGVRSESEQAFNYTAISQLDNRC